MKFKKFLQILAIVLLLFSFLANAKYISNSIINSLNFCYKSLIPSIFPFLLISQIILYSNWLDSLFQYDKNDKNNILGICKIYFSSIFLGMLCGFIIGASNICKKYKEINDKNDITDYVFLSSNASCGFVIGCVGATLFNDIKIGIFLYIAQLFFSVFLYLIFKSKKQYKNNITSIYNRETWIKILSKSIKQASDSMFSICSFTIVFRALISLLNLFVNKRNNVFINSVISSTLEFTSGVFSSIQIKNEYISLFIIGFSVGFGGLSIILQTISLCESLKFKRIKFTFLKLFQGILCGFSMIFYKIITNFIM